MSRAKASIADFDARMAPLNGSDAVPLWHNPDKPPFRLKERFTPGLVLV